MAPTARPLARTYKCWTQMSTSGGIIPARSTFSYVHSACEIVSENCLGAVDQKGELAYRPKQIALE